MKRRLHRHGLVLGKFMPAHLGHLHLIHFACSLCERVTVVVDQLAGEWPHAGVRAEALQRDLAGLPASVHALGSPTPQAPDAHPQFWRFWRETLVEACGGPPDALVCSMDYGPPLAEALGCALLPLDLAREAIPLSATAIRADPWRRWDDILPHARLPYLARVAVEGPESTGKSTLALAAARVYGFGYAPEWAKSWIDHGVATGRPFQEEDLLVIAQGHLAQERSLELTARRALLCDSSLLTTLAWGQLLYGRSDPRIEALFAAEEGRAPRARWLFTPETPWTPDTHRRVAPAAARDKTRRRFFDLLVGEAERRGLAYEVVPGGFADKRIRVLDLAARLAPPT